MDDFKLENSKSSIFRHFKRDTVDMMYCFFAEASIFHSFFSCRCFEFYLHVHLAS